MASLGQRLTCLAQTLPHLLHVNAINFILPSLSVFGIKTKFTKYSRDTEYPFITYQTSAI
jgi:hypothetical protein